MLLTTKNGLPLLLLGVGYSMFGAVTWTTVPFIVIEKYTVFNLLMNNYIFLGNRFWYNDLFAESISWSSSFDECLFKN